MKTLQSAMLKDLGLLESMFGRRSKLGQIMCNVKIDAVCLILEKDENGQINYYSRAKVPLDNVKRIGVGIYEGAIEFLNSKRLDLIPNRTEIHLEIFPKVLDETLQFSKSKYQPSIIDYTDFMDEEGTSGIILSLAISNGQYLSDSSTIANILEVDSQPNIKLAKDIDLSALETVLSTKYAEMDEFSLDYFRILFDLVLTAGKIVPNEGFVIHDTVSNQSYKIQNPVFNTFHKEKKEEFQLSSYSKYSDTMIDLVFDEIDKNSSLIKTKKILHKDDYISFVSVVSCLVYAGIKDSVNDYIQENRVDFTKRPTRLNYKKLEEYFEVMVQSEPGLEDVFRIVLFNFKKLKKRCSKIITADRKQLINSIIKMGEPC
ncbi:MAG: hypothetical protein QM489_00705 [Candidatus Izemoplasma sp.]